MYVTRRLSEYQQNPSELEQAPPEGPNSGVLVIKDEEEPSSCFCFGFCDGSKLRSLPFPQNAKLSMVYELRQDNCDGTSTNSTCRDPLMFIPVLGQPLSSNRYYVLERKGKYSGTALASAKERDRVHKTGCFSSYSYIPEAGLQQPDPYDIYQQFEIHQIKSAYACYDYTATSVAPDGKPPEQFLTEKYWSVWISTSEDFGLVDDAKGLNTKLRAQLPNAVNSEVEVGNWYVPFIFVKERGVKDPIKNSAYYSMTLYQRWEEVNFCENVEEVEVKQQVVKLEGEVIEKETRSVKLNGVVWFEVGEKKIGLSSLVLERVKWEEERFGWRSDPVEEVVKRSERFDGDGENGKSFRCYVLVETFVLKRFDGSFVLEFEFRHLDKLKTKWV